MQILTIVGFDRERKIHATKDIRALSTVVLGENLGLKDAKALIDFIEDGGQVEFDLSHGVFEMVAHWLENDSYLTVTTGNPNVRSMESFKSKPYEPVDPYADFGDRPEDADIPF